MALGTVVVGLGIGVVFGGIAAVCFLGAYSSGVQTVAAFRDPAPVDSLGEGLVKVRGTARPLDHTLTGSVADGEVLMSEVVCERAEGVTGKLGDYDEHRRLGRAVSFEIVDDSDSVKVAFTEDLVDDNFAGLGRDATVEVDAGDPVPEDVDRAFHGTEAAEATVEALEASDEEGTDELAEALREDREADPDDPSTVFEERSPLRAGVPQRFTESYLAPGDDVYVVGTLDDGRITNHSLGFQVRHETRGFFELFGEAAMAGILGILGVAFTVGAFNAVIGSF